MPRLSRMLTASRCFSGRADWRVSRHESMALCFEGTENYQVSAMLQKETLLYNGRSKGFVLKHFPTGHLKDVVLLLIE